MHLLEFPPEIFQGVIHELVTTAGVSHAWRMRGVCRTFAAEIAHDVVARQPKEALMEGRNRQVLAQNLARYLYHRVKAPMDVKPDLPQIIKNMCRYLQQELSPIRVKEDTMLMDICEGLVKMFTAQEILPALWDRPLGYVWFVSTGMPLERWDDDGVEKTLWDKLVAAIAVGSHDLTRQLLHDDTDTAPTNTGRWTLLDFGHALRDHELVNIVKKKIRSHNLNKKVNRDLKARYLVAKDSAFNLEHSLERAVQPGRGDPSITQTLVDLYTQFLPLPSNPYYTGLLVKSVRNGHADTMAILLDMPHRTTWRGMSKVFYEACNFGGRKFVDLLLDSSKFDLDKGSSLTMPLFVAVRSGDAAGVDAVVERSKATMSTRVEPNYRLYDGSKTVTAIDMAIHQHDTAMVKVLLDHGSSFKQPTETWPYHKKIRKLLFAAAGKTDPKTRRKEDTNQSKLTAYGYGKKG